MNNYLVRSFQYLKTVFVAILDWLDRVWDSISARPLMVFLFFMGCTVTFFLIPLTGGGIKGSASDMVKKDKKSKSDYYYKSLQKARDSKKG